MSIKENILEIQSRIEAAAKKSGRNAEDITLVAVSKTVDIPLIMEAVDFGLTEFGENRPQEIRDKSKIIQNVNWHQIGQLQTNKIKYVAGKTKLIHSVDSAKLLEELEKHFEFTVDGLAIKAGAGTMTLVLDHDIIRFEKNGQQFGWWDGVNFHTGNIVINLDERAQFGNFAFVPRSNGSLDFLKVGG